MMGRFRRLVCCAVLLLASTAIVSSAAALAAKSESARQYEKLVENEVGTRWYAMIERYGKQVPLEKIRVHFFVNPNRRIRVVSVTPSRPGDLLTKLTLEALAQAKVPAIPHDLLTRPDQLEYELGFEFYSR